MMELAGLNEIKVTAPNPLNYLLDLQSKIKASKDPLEKLSLAIKCAEKVLFIFEKEFPNNKYPYKAIEVAKKYLADPTEKNKRALLAASTRALNAAKDAEQYSAASYAATSAWFAWKYGSHPISLLTDDIPGSAINAVKEYYNLNEIKIDKHG